MKKETSENQDILEMSRDNTRDSPFYTDAYAHLLDELRWLNRLIAAQVLRLRQVNFYGAVKDFRGFFVADDEIDALLAAGIFEKDGKVDDEARASLIARLLSKAEAIRAEIARRVQASVRQNVFLPLVHLSQVFGLSELEHQVLVICLAPQIDARYERLYAYLQNDITKRVPSIDLILSLFCQTMEERVRGLCGLGLAARLRHFGLIENIESEIGTSAAQHFLRIDPRLVDYALGSKVIDKRIEHNLRLLALLSWDQVVVDEALKSRLQKLFRLANEDDTSAHPILYLHGRRGVGKKTMARAVCGEANLPLAVVDMPSLLGSPEHFIQKVRLIFREGLLQPCGVCFDQLQALEIASEDNSALIRGLMQAIREYGGIIFLASENPLPAALLDLPATYPIEIPAPNAALQQTLWKFHLNGALGEQREFDQLTARFDLTGEQIAKAVHFASQTAVACDPANGHIALDDLFASSRVQSQPKLSTLARKIEPKYGWDDLVLPDDQMEQLRELTNWVKHRQTVMGEWGFASKLSLGRGINALFVGPSGTGKTMAAEVIAHELALDLYKIDLSAVVSKYIGETEKNLSRIFAEAEHSNAILFFDEADALFGKRSEVRDAHDRYANIEIAYLLQKMEEYEGITILATNFKQNVDEAFFRRICFIIEFSFPNEEYRRRIWQKVFPKEIPMDLEIDFDFLARQYKLAGGNIRNVALTAAFYSADDGNKINMQLLLRATRREYQKMGKQFYDS